MQTEAIDQLVESLGLRDHESLYSRACLSQRHSLCMGTSYSLRRLHPMLAMQKNTKRGEAYDQGFPCLCECHGPFMESSYDPGYVAVP